jgi:hypothetical protein
MPARCKHKQMPENLNAETFIRWVRQDIRMGPTLSLTIKSVVTAINPRNKQILNGHHIVAFNSINKIALM